MRLTFKHIAYTFATQKIRRSPEIRSSEFTELLNNVRNLVLSHVWFFCDPMDCTRQTPLSMGFSWPEFWNGLPFLPPGDLPVPGIEPASLGSPVLVGRLFTTSNTWEATGKRWQWNYLQHDLIWKHECVYLCASDANVCLLREQSETKYIKCLTVVISVWWGLGSNFKNSF